MELHSVEVAFPALAERVTWFVVVVVIGVVAVVVVIGVAVVVVAAGAAAAVVAVCLFALLCFAFLLCVVLHFGPNVACSYP